MKSKSRLIQVVIMICILVSALGFLPMKEVWAVEPQVLVNEVDADNPSTDTAEFVELYDGGEGGTSLDGLVLVFYNGSNDESYKAIDLDSYTTDGDGYFVICGDAANIPNCDLDVAPDSNLIQNGADAVALYSGDADNFPNGTSVTTTNLIDALVYDTNDSDDSELLVLLNPGQPQVNEGGGGDSTMHSNQRCPNGSGGVLNTDTYTQFTPTPGTENCTIAVSDPKINEFSASTTGTDVEYVEIYGDAAADYEAYTVLEIEGDSSGAGVIDEVIAIGTTDDNGFYLVNLPANALENGTISLLLVKDFTGTLSADLDTDNDGTLDETPWIEIVDSVAVNDGGSGDLTYATTELYPNYDGVSSYAPGGASRIPDGYDTDAITDWVRNDFDLAGIPGFDGSIAEGEAYNTPGAPNEVYTPEASDPKINEFSASTTGTDVEYVEIYGDAAADYGAYTVLEIEGDSSGAGVIDEVIGIGMTDASGFYLVDLPANALENGTITLLLVKDFTGVFGDDLDTNNDGAFDSTPWSEIIDSVAVNDGGSSDLTYGVPVLTQNYDGLSSYAPGGASRIPDGYDTDAITDWVRNDFDLAGIPGFDGTAVVGEAYNTPGAPNEVYTPPPEACGDPYTPIYEIQGSGLSTPLAETNLATEGFVVGDFQTGGLDGFFIQDATGDGSPTTSDGIFVYAPGSMDVSVGDYVRVRGTASEYYDLTEIGASQVWQCASSLPLPAPTALALPVTTVDDLEAFEGMYVTFPQDLVISEYFNFDRFGEIVLTTQRYLQFTAVNVPDDAGFAAANEAFSLNSITLDDGRTDQNPDPARHPNGSEFTLDNRFRGGDLVTNLTGVLDYSYSLYRIQPTEGADYTPSNPRPVTPDLLEGELKIASMNVLNYFVTIDTGAEICGPSGDLECRGADDTGELDRQRAKILAAQSTMNADVVGLIEIENDSPYGAGDAVADLVAGLNDLLGAGTYDYVPTGAIGTDAIKVALIYKPAKVTPIGAYAILDSTVDPRFLDDYNRPVLAASFKDNWSEEVFTVAVNHLKSKGSDCNAVEDYDQFDGAGNCNLTRLAAAEAEVDWLATDPTGSGFDNFIIIGDLNSYDKEAPIDAIKAGADDMLGTGDDYFDLLYVFRDEDAYSYVFDGRVGYLDYAMANANFAQYIDDVTAWHINADEPDLIDYDTSFKKDAQDAIYAPDAYRSSDHDPVIVTFTFDYDVVPVDILPGSCENPFNVKGKGVLPVAILGTADLDVTQIDPAFVMLAGVSPLRWNFEDVATAFDCSNSHGDGYLDLILHYDAQEIVLALGEVMDGDLITLKLVGRLLPEFGETPIIGEDVIWILKKGKK